MDSEIALKQLSKLIDDEGQWTDIAAVQAILEALAAASFENGRKQAFEELRHLIGAATQPGR